MMNVLLTPKEKDNLSKWNYQVEDSSITTKIFTPFWNYLVDLIPKSVSPNVISLAGLLCILYGFHLTYNYYAVYPTIVSIAVMILTFTYMHLDAIDGKHARKIRNSSPLGELFDHACDSIGLVFIVLTACLIFNINNTSSQWYLVQTAQLVFLMNHISALQDKVVKFGSFYGPGEVLIMYIGLIVLSRFVEISSLLYPQILPIIYYLTLGLTVYSVVKLNSFPTTRKGLLVCLLARFVPSVLVYFGVFSTYLNTYMVAGDGLIMSVIIGDTIVCKMAKRDLHPWVAILTMVSLFDSFLSIIMCLCYYSMLFYEISSHLRIPVFTVHYNVFCNGVYDLCHEGHMNLFEQAASHGTRLIVGVHSDKDVVGYKRKPNMSMDERCRVVSRCRFVDQVVPNCPLYLTEKFIKKHSIHIVVCSEEYDAPDDEYYKVPREMGILKVLPRTPGISTSELMARIKNK